MTNDLFDPKSFLERSSQKTGFHRERYVERNIPTDLKDILVIFFFGDYKARFLLSTLLLKNYIKQIKHARYSILCSWPGDNIYPYVDEYWSLASGSTTQDIMSASHGFKNNHTDLSVYESNLLRYFPGDVINADTFGGYFDNGFTKKFFEHYRKIDYYLPSIPSPSMDIAKRLSQANYSVFLCPSRRIRIWRNGKEDYILVNLKFWEILTNRLIQEGITPVIWLDALSYDISPLFANKCIYITANNFLNVLSCMRASTCVLDVCTGISKLALMARAPFLTCDSRQHYFGMHEFEIDDLCGEKIQKDYLFLFGNSIESDWIYSVEQIIVKLKKFLPKIDRNKLISGAESDDILVYENVRKMRAKKIGLNFIKINNEKV